MRKLLKTGFIAAAFVFGLMLTGVNTASAQSWHRERDARRDYRDDVRDARRDYRRDVRRGENPYQERREYREEVRDARRDYYRDSNRDNYIYQRRYHPVVRSYIRIF